MLSFLLSVVVISLSGVMMPGPLFAVTVAKSYKSQFAGAQISAGHALVEIPLILLIYFGLGRFFQHELVQLTLSLLGGVVLLWLGIGMFRARARVVETGKDLPYNSVVAGVVTSTLNPFFILWWVTIGSMLVMKSLNFGITGFALFIPFTGYVTWPGSRLCRFWFIEPARSGEENFKRDCLLPVVYYLSGLGFGLWYQVSSSWFRLLPFGIALIVYQASYLVSLKRS